MSRTGETVLYVGPLNPSGTCYARYRGLLGIRPAAEGFDSSFVGQHGSRIYRYLENRFCAGRTFIQANRELSARAEAMKPSVIWVDKGFWIWPETLRRLKSLGILLIHHNTDDIFSPEAGLAYRLLRGTIPFYDMHFTTNGYNVEALRAAGATRVEKTFLGYDSERFFPRPLSPEESERWSHPVVFVGHWEPSTEAYAVRLVQAGLPLKIYGWNWRKAARQDVLRGVIQSRYLEGDEYVNCLRGARIGLGFLSKKNRNQTAGRTFEIPASGTFLVAERTEEHRLLYREGEEAEFFSTADELISKVQRYLKDETSRTRIAFRGYQRCVDSGYSYGDRMKADWEKVRSVLS